LVEEREIHNCSIAWNITIECELGHTFKRKKSAWGGDFWLRFAEERAELATNADRRDGGARTALLNAALQACTLS
jgi:hypothetical protein